MSRNNNRSSSTRLADKDQSSIGERRARVGACADECSYSKSVALPVHSRTVLPCLHLRHRRSMGRHLAYGEALWAACAACARWHE